MDLTTLATRICAGLDGVRACVLLSGDGLTLAAHPTGGEARAREVWARLQELGNPARGFMDVGEEVWVVLRRGPYTGVLVSGPGTRPGLLLDKLEYMLRTAEESRAREATDMVTTTPTRSEGARRPRPALHAEPSGRGSKGAPKKPTKKDTAPVSEPAATAAAKAREAPRYEPPEVLQGAAERVVDITEAAGEPDPEPAQNPGPAKEDPTPRPVEGEVDRVALAREFRQLLRDSEG